MNPPRLSRLVAALLATAAAPALAQTGADAVDDEEIVVTAARTTLPASALPITVDVIDAEDLAEQVAIGGSIVDAVAALSPSFSPTRQKLSGSGETLRGRSPLYAINGIPQSTPIRDGARDGYTIDPFFIDRVELIYGSNALQGIGATGGVVNQVTVGPPRDDGFSGRFLLQGTANDGFEGDSLGYKAAGLAGWRGGAFDAMVGAAYERRGVFHDAEGRIIGPDTTQGEVQDSDSWSVFGRFGLAVGGGGRLDLIANRFTLQGDGDYVPVPGDIATGLPTTGALGVTPGVPPENRVETLALSYTDGDLAGGNLAAQIFFNRSRDIFGGGAFPTFQDIALAPLGSLFDQSGNRSRKYGARASYERAVPGVDGLTATLGVDALWDRTEQSLVLTDRIWVPPVDYRSIAPFAQVNLALFDEHVRVAGGARWENVRIGVEDFTTLAFYGSRMVAGGEPRFGEPLLNGGAIVEPFEGLRVYASYAEGYTVPDVGRILRAINVEGVDVDEFLDISPVISNNREIGIELDRGPLDASITYFRSSSSLGSLLVLVGDVFEVQRQRIAIEGLEINLGVATPVPGLALSIGYAHLAGRTDSNGDDRLDADLDGANISPDRLNLAASYQSGPLSARLQGQWFLGRTFDGLPAASNFEGYTLVDAAVRYETALGGVSLSVANLLDNQYLSYSSQTVRSANPLQLFAGRGRTITLGWDHRF